MHANLLSEEAYPKPIEEDKAEHDEFKTGDTSLVEVLLNKLAIGENQQPSQQNHKKRGVWRRLLSCASSRCWMSLEHNPTTNEH